MRSATSERTHELSLEANKLGSIRHCRRPWAERSLLVLSAMSKVYFRLIDDELPVSIQTVENKGAALVVQGSRFKVMVSARGGPFRDATYLWPIVSRSS